METELALQGEPYRIIDSFIPVGKDYNLISISISHKLSRFGTFIDVRNPTNNRDLFGDTTRFNPASLWHRDSRGSFSTAPRVIYLWSTVKFTEIWVVGEYEPRPAMPPYSIVVVDNHKCLHRPPRNFGYNRWFGRAIMDIEPAPIDPELLAKEEIIPAHERMRELAWIQEEGIWKSL